MNRHTRIFAAAAMALAAHASMAAGSPGVEHNVQGFLDAVAAAGGKPLEQLSPADARAVLVSVQAGPKLALPSVDISTRTIQADGRDIKLHVVRPAKASGTLPVFMFFHGGGWVLGDFPTHERLVRDLVAVSYTHLTLPTIYSV